MNGMAGREKRVDRKGAGDRVQVSGPVFFVGLVPASDSIFPWVHIIRPMYPPGHPHPPWKPQTQREETEKMKVQKADWKRMEEYGNLWIGYHRQCASLATYLHVFLTANDGRRIDKRLQKKLDDFVANYHDVKFLYPLDKVFFDGLQDKKRGQYYLEVSWLPTTALTIRSFRPYWEHMSRNRWPYMQYQSEQVSLNTRLFLGYDPVVNLKEIEFNYSPHALDETYHRKQIAFLQSQIVTLEEPVAKWNETVELLDCMKQHMKKLVPSVSGYDDGILRFLESKD